MSSNYDDIPTIEFSEMLQEFSDKSFYDMKKDIEAHGNDVHKDGFRSQFTSGSMDILRHLVVTFLPPNKNITDALSNSGVPISMMRIGWSGKALGGEGSVNMICVHSEQDIVYSMILREDLGALKLVVHSTEGNADKSSGWKIIHVVREVKFSKRINDLSSLGGMDEMIKTGIKMSSWIAKEWSERFKLSNVSQETKH